MSKKNGRGLKEKKDQIDLELALDGDLNKVCEEHGMEPTPRQRVTIKEAQKIHKDSQKDSYVEK